MFEPNLLETGGGIKNLEHRIGDEVFIVYSGDILTDLPVDRLVDEHFSRQNDVTLALRRTGLSTSISWCRETGRVVDFLGALGSGKRGEYDFAGISIWNSSVFSRIPKATKISFVPIIVEWLKSGGRIGGVALEENRWFNIGSRTEYLRVHQIIAVRRVGRLITSATHLGRSRSNVLQKSRQRAKSKVDLMWALCAPSRRMFFWRIRFCFQGRLLPQGTTLRSCIVGGRQGRRRDLSGYRLRMSIERLIHQTRERFPHYDQSQVEILPLDKGGSERRYYRVRFSVDHSLILVKYNPEKIENERFVAIANFLNGIGVNSPLIYYHELDQGLIWMQDLGEDDLWQYRTESWAVRRRFYETALDQVAVLHSAELALGENLRLQLGFDESLYRWEQNYCLENCLGLYFQVPAAEIERLREHASFANLAKRLASYPTGFGSPRFSIAEYHHLGRASLPD